MVASSWLLMTDYAARWRTGLNGGRFFWRLPQILVEQGQRPPVYVGAIGGLAHAMALALKCPTGGRRAGAIIDLLG